MRSATALRLQAGASTRYEMAQRRAASGQRVQAPSDDPRAYARAETLRQQMSTIDARVRSAGVVRGDLELSEGVLAEASEIMTQASELAVRMRSGTMSAGDRSAAASEVLGLRDALRSLANTQGSRGYLFAGTQTDAPPVDAAFAFVGRDDAMNVQLSDTLSIRSNVSGASAFANPAGVDVFAALTSLSQALSAGDPAAIGAAMDPIAAGRAQLTSARVDAGLLAQRVTRATEVGEGTLFQLQKSLSSETEVDAASSYSALLSAQQSYERSIAVARQLLSMSSQGGS
jgi:flagellar hook-associated protein 3 FlgL